MKAKPLALVVMLLAYGPANHLRQGYGAPPKLHAEAEAGHDVPPQTPDAERSMHGGTNNIRYSALTQINRDNVTKLQVAWTYDSNDAFKGSEMQSNPVIVDGMLYVTTPTLKVVAIVAESGHEVWK